MKLLFCSLFVIAVVSVVSGSNSTWGIRTNADILLSRVNVYRPVLKGTYTSDNVNFPNSGETNSKTITAIFVYDRFTNSSGAHATLWSGGPGFRFATINLKSQYNYGINSTVDIYGK